MSQPSVPPVAAVTGAANGIGRAVAQALVEAGWIVAGLDREPVALDGVTGMELDVTRLDALEPAVERVEAELGSLGALVNVAGAFTPASVEALTPAVLRGQLALLLEGPVLLARAAGLRMAARGAGRIVNVTSVHATHGEERSLAYDAAKAGLEAATRTLAIELGPRGVLVNAVAPGFVRTRMSLVDGVDELDSDWFREVYVQHRKLPLRRPADPAEIAAAVEHLVSERNTYVTGHSLVVDGGLTVTF
jgi:NAD(P)-dependent dehydrogenase (short-subunit alcohol dehydrogenase family)